MTDLYADVKAFHARFGLPTHERPALLDEATFRFRYGFLLEEVQEFYDAHQAGDLAGCLDALNDLVYVAIGSALFMGLPFNAGWTEVQRANMEKVRAASADDSKRGSTWDCVKPEGWRAPDHRPALAAALVGKLNNAHAIRWFYEQPRPQQLELLAAAGIEKADLEWYDDPLPALQRLYAERKLDKLIAGIYAAQMQARGG